MSKQVALDGADRDAFGRMLMDYLVRGEANEVVEREDGFIGASRMGPPTYFAPYEDWRAHEQRAMQALVPGRVLDVGCGAGRVGLHLQAQGYEVVGIDNSPLAVEVCRRRGVKDARLLSVTQIGPQLGQFGNVRDDGQQLGVDGQLQAGALAAAQDAPHDHAGSAHHCRKQ